MMESSLVDFRGILIQGWLKFSKGSPKPFQSVWYKYWAVLEGPNLYLFPTTSNGNVVDLNAEYVFDVGSKCISSISALDPDEAPIHFKELEVSFRFTYALTAESPSTALYFVCASKDEHSNWLWCLNTTKKQMQRNAVTDVTPAVLTHTTTIDNVKSLEVTGHCIIDEKYLVVASASGMYLSQVEATGSKTLKKISDLKRGKQLYFDADRFLVLMIAGKGHIVHLVNPATWTDVRLEETKGCKTYAPGVYKDKHVAIVSTMKKKVILIDYSAFPVISKVDKEFVLPEVGFSISQFGDKLYVMYDKYIRIISLKNYTSIDTPLYPRPELASLVSSGVIIGESDREEKLVCVDGTYSLPARRVLTPR